MIDLNALVNRTHVATPVKQVTKPVATTDNTEVKAFLNEFMSYEELPRWIDDVIYGAGGQMPGIRLNPAVIFRMLQSLDTISTVTLESCMNRKRVALGEKAYAKSTVEHYTRICRCASQGIAHHAMFKSSFKQSNILPYSDEELEMIKTLARKSSLDELKAYEKELKIKYTSV